MLRPFAEDLWIADGPIANVAGFHYPTRMAVIRLSGGGLFVWSPVALSDALKAAVDGLGAVRSIVAPNSLHDRHLAAWRQAYPDAAMPAPPGLRVRRNDLTFDDDLADGSVHDWSGEIDHVLVHGNLITTEVVFFHRQSRTAIFSDLIQHFSPDWFSGWRAVIARLDLMTAAQPEVPRKFRNAFVGRRVARESLRRVLAWPAERVLMAHAPPVTQDGQAFIRRAFRWLGV
ncbi:MAG: DUF4336 domain-containing protein [Caulobacter sp.]|nr:DUF4336 domain-containing protein [Caulobacter sp.]